MNRTDFLAYRIMKGHLSYSGDGLSIYIKEPNPDLMFRSIIVYEEYYNKVIYNMDDDEEKDIFEEYLKLKKLNSPQKFEY
jgi:hypothetical protein